MRGQRTHYLQCNCFFLRILLRYSIRKSEEVMRGQRTHYLQCKLFFQNTEVWYFCPLRYRHENQSGQNYLQGKYFSFLYTEVRYFCPLRYTHETQSGQNYLQGKYFSFLYTAVSNFCPLLCEVQGKRIIPARGFDIIKSISLSLSLPLSYSHSLSLAPRYGHC